MPGEEGESYEEALKRRLRELRVDASGLWIEYERQTDTLYINFGKEEPDETIMLEDDTIIGVRGDRLVSIVVQDFGRRVGLRQW